MMKYLKVLRERGVSLNHVNDIIMYCNLCLITCFITIIIFNCLNLPTHSNQVNQEHFQILMKVMNESISKYSGSPAPEHLNAEQLQRMKLDAIFDGKQIQSCFHKLQAEWNGAEHYAIHNKMTIWNAIVKSQYSHEEILSELPILL